MTDRADRPRARGNSIELRAIVKRGREAGTVLTPHRYADGSYIVSKTRFERDYLRVSSLTEAAAWVRCSYRLRMSSPDSTLHRSPSLIAPQFIDIAS